MQKRVEHDLYYIDNWSLALDLQILTRTVLSRSSCDKGIQRAAWRALWTRR
jgi:lipopolysaccharide/colanic/teichoic acid biosynthesis glycosyltransferase